MKYENISPSGYQYTKEPKATHPFWSEGEELIGGLTYTISSDNKSDFSSYEVPAGAVGTYKFKFNFNIEYEYEKFKFNYGYKKTIEHKLTSENIDFKQNLNLKAAEVLPLDFIENKYIGILLTTFINFNYESNRFTLGNIEISLSNVNKLKYLHIELLNVSVEVV